MIRNTRTLLVILGTALLMLAACGDEAATPADSTPANNDGNNDNNGGKADTPANNDTPENQCEDRRQDVLNSAQKGFTETAIRWACADVAGVNTVGNDDRGQEYCEYFAIISPPPVDGEEGGERPASVATGQNLEGGGTTDLKVDLNEDQLFYLEDHPDEVVGQCVFTSWHADVPGPLPVCEDEACANADVMGIPLTAENFQMKVGFNSNVAASALVRDCLQGRQLIANPDDPNDPLHSDFFRGCMVTAELYGTHWRRSDPSVCAAAIRLRECGCSLPDNADVPTSLVPTQPVRNEAGEEVITLRGFRLATWSGERDLPLGCRYHDTGEDSQGLVVCDLTASDLLVSTDDPKGKCREKYGDNVVVHVPIPQGVITCNPPENGPHAETCSQTPWVVDN